MITKSSNSFIFMLTLAHSNSNYICLSYHLARIFDFYQLWPGVGIICLDPDSKLR
jgi:hypothetical protein